MRAASIAETSAENPGDPVSSGNLEPASLLRQFIACPPVGFTIDQPADEVPVFAIDFDILTTLHPGVSAWIRTLPGAAAWTSKLTMSAHFAGTTVSEYFPLPRAMSPARLVTRLKAAFGQRSQLLVLKDIPCQSPFLDSRSNAAAAELIDAATAAGFVMVSGQALAYVRLDFGSTELFLQRFSRSHRRDLRRKLRANAQLAVSAVATGSSIFTEEAVLDEFYELYLNVYRQSSVHFDLLTPEFFRMVLQDAGSGGQVFIYRHGQSMIGWNLCFVVGGNLVDKYIGFRYPEARHFNLYAVSWFHNLAFAHTAGCRYYIAGWTDPEIKAYLGASFTMTRHAVFVRHPVLRFLLKHIRGWFEPDATWSPEAGKRSTCGHP